MLFRLTKMHLKSSTLLYFEDPVKANRFFQPIIDHLNALQVNGLSINNHHLKFTFSTLAADNLAAHMVGGFQTSFSSGNFCRRCYVKYSEKNIPFSISKPNSRTHFDHDQFVEKITRHRYESPLMGITGESLFKNLIGFHPTTSLPGDVMHDFVEGVCPLIMMALLKQASSMRLITYGEI